MENDMMQRLAMLLSGQSASPPAAPQAAIVPQMMVQNTQYGQRPGDWPTPPVKPDKGKGGGGGHKGPKFTPTQRLENRAGIKGPMAYSPAMNKNIGRNVVTPGYGDNPAPQPSPMMKLLDLFTPQGGM